LWHETRQSYRRGPVILAHVMDLGSKLADALEALSESSVSSATSWKRKMRDELEECQQNAIMWEQRAEKAEAEVSRLKSAPSETQEERSDPYAKMAMLQPNWELTSPEPSPAQPAEIPIDAIRRIRKERGVSLKEARRIYAAERPAETPEERTIVVWDMPAKVDDDE
jgi:hypothetical protein